MGRDRTEDGLVDVGELEGRQLFWNFYEGKLGVRSCGVGIVEVRLARGGGSSTLSIVMTCWRMGIARMKMIPIADRMMIVWIRLVNVLDSILRKIAKLTKLFKSGHLRYFSFTIGFRQSCSELSGRQLTELSELQRLSILNHRHRANQTIYNGREARDRRKL